MKHRRTGAIPFFIVVSLFTFGLLISGDRSAEGPIPAGAAASDAPARPEDEPSRDGTSVSDATVDDEAIAVAPPPFTKGIFPCSECHEDLKPNPKRRKLTKNHKKIVLRHDEKNRWCMDCHSFDNDVCGDKLHLANGTLIDFTESYRLCGQCHGPRLRDWKAGEHGKRTGEWSGKKQYLLCASCHNPHTPKFKSVKPLPPPVRPEDLR